MFHMTSIKMATLTALLTVSSFSGSAFAQNPTTIGDSPILRNPEMVSYVAYKEEPTIETLKIDASSATAFVFSLDSIRAILPGDKEEHYNNALDILAARAQTTEDSSLQSREEAIYTKYGKQLNGKTYEAILKLAK